MQGGERPGCSPGVSVLYERWKIRDTFSKQKRNDGIRAESWRKTLEKACDLPGWPVTHENELDMVKQIVDAILKILISKKEDKFQGVEHLSISLQDILLATNAFAKENLIAGGGFGKVYFGRSKDHGLLAVKQLDRQYGQGDHEFMMEIQLLSAYKHENIVTLVGFCNNDCRALVYKYEANGSLDKVLHRKDLTWIHRLRISFGAARGLKYLHEDVGYQHRVLHRDIKSSNILLDENWNAKISDFGLSKVALRNVPCSTVITNVCGTFGYIDPQYFKCGILTQKSDVYSFGVVLNEVLFGKLVTMDEHPDEHHFSVKLAKVHYEKGTLHEIIDPDLWIQMDSKSIEAFLKIAFDCLKKRGEERPTMRIVMEELKKALDYQLSTVGT